MIKKIATPEYCSVYFVDGCVSEGVAEASKISNTDWFVNRVFIRNPLGRGRGLGSRLIKELQSLVASRGCKKLIVTPGGYNSDPEKQINFYRKNGFEGKEELVWMP